MAPRPASPTTTTTATSTTTSTSTASASATDNPQPNVPSSTLRTASIVATVLFVLLLILAIVNFAILHYKKKRSLKSNPYYIPAPVKRGSFLRARGISKSQDEPPVVQITEHESEAGGGERERILEKEKMFAPRSRSSSTLTVYIPQEQVSSTPNQRLSTSNVNLIPLHPADVSRSGTTSTSRSTSTHSWSSTARYGRGRTEDWDDSADLSTSRQDFSDDTSTAREYTGRRPRSTSSSSLRYYECGTGESDEQAQGLR